MLCMTCGQREATVVCVGGPNPLFCSQDCIDAMNAIARQTNAEFQEREKLLAKPYHLCAYGHTVRCSERTDSIHQAMKETYGLVTERITVLTIRGTSWKYLTKKAQQKHLDALKAAHKAKTGNEITQM